MSNMTAIYDKMEHIFLLEKKWSILATISLELQMIMFCS